MGRVRVRARSGSRLGYRAEELVALVQDRLRRVPRSDACRGRRARGQDRAEGRAEIARERGAVLERVAVCACNVGRRAIHQ
jgi:hypothetical protein